MSNNEEEYRISAEPVKSFFVSMLTRDISLEDAILDLLDNCVDGILRSVSSKVIDTEKPYEGYEAKIEFSKNSFTICDNCGGIPWSLSKYAFQMGRPSDRPSDPNDKRMVGVYGIGMKRAIFKMGMDCTITTKHENDAYSVRFSPEWIRDENDWHIQAEHASLKNAGTTIHVCELHADAMTRFSESAEGFPGELYDKIVGQYAIIIDKGFAISVNGKTVIPRPIKLTFAKKDVPSAVRPYIFMSRVDDVDVFLTVGFTRRIPSEGTVLEEQEDKKFSSQNAGWTIVCNDRVVLYCDRSELTGWGEAGVPRYHTQFIAVAGILEFSSNDASKLPTTTTKRGIDASSTLYLQVKNRMREGMKLFTDYTNKWKGDTARSRTHFDEKNTELLPLTKLKKEAERLSMTKTRGTALVGEYYKPNLPMPQDKTRDSSSRIAFTVEKDKIEPVRKHLGMDQGSDASSVGKACFNEVYEEARSCR